MTQTKRRSKPSVFPLSVEAGPYIEMDDALDPPAAESTRANLLQNVYPLNAELGEGVVGRPGFNLMGAQSPAGAVTGQGIYQFTKLDVPGTEYTVRIMGGRFETFNWTARVWTEVLTTAQLTAAAITLSTTARVGFATFNNKLIVSDGVNTPWAWDGQTGAGLTKLTNAPVFYGPPTVYSAKLVGIKATDRATFVWSEENDPNTGYQATISGFTYANAWTLGQTDQNALVAMRGTNSALFYWREETAGAIFGKINSEFVTSATHDLFSVGTRSPWAIAQRSVQGEEGFIFPDNNGRPQWLPIGGTPKGIWMPYRETLHAVPRVSLVDALAIDWRLGQLMLIGVTEALQAAPSAWLAYRITDNGLKAAGIFRGFVASNAAIVKNLTGERTWVHLSTDGYAYDHGNPDGQIWDDTFASGTVAIQHIVQGMPMAGDPPGDSQFQRADLFTRAGTQMTIAWDYETPRARSLSLTGIAVGGGFGTLLYWDLFMWDVALWGGGATELHTAIGLSGLGRWIKPRITHAIVGEQFGFAKWRISGAPAGDSPFTP